MDESVVRKQTKIRWMVVVSLVVALSGCLSEESPAGPADPSGGDGSVGSGGGGSTTVSLVNDVQPIFNQTCANSSCHGSSQSGNLDLRSGNSWANLVNVLASGAAIVRAIPGDAQGSYVIIKLEGRQSSGATMPLTGNLTTLEIQTIRDWIDQGAADN
jgi:predicted CxxxxCH...CXXCH cytochrome family protein